MADEYTEGTDDAGKPVLIRKSDGRRVMVYEDNAEFCRLLNSPMDVILPAEVQEARSACRFFCVGMKDEFIEFVRSNGMMLSVEELYGHVSLRVVHQHSPFRNMDFKKLCIEIASDDSTAVDGLTHYPRNFFVSNNLLGELNGDLNPDDSTQYESQIRMLSSLPMDKAFVYFDVSDFSELPAGQQALIIKNLTRMTSDSSYWNADKFEETALERVQARLCIGDGYIFCFDDSITATYFAGRLAQKVEEAVADESLLVSFHFRAGVHVGPVYRFYEHELNRWNYVGDGINGGSRVLEAIGKETDDVVFVSHAVRKDIINGVPNWPFWKTNNLKQCLHNRGRKKDKHGKPWRVYELNHMNVN